MNVSDVSFYFEGHRIIFEPLFFSPPISSHLPLLTTVSELDAPLESYSGGVSPVPSISSSPAYFGGSCLSLSL